MNAVEPCATPHCDKTLKASARSEYCVACRASFRYWKRPDKGVGAILVRHRQLQKWTDRVLILGGREEEFRPAAKVIRKDQRAAAKSAGR